MTKKRPIIPKGLKDSILREYNYRCAICGIERPHLHHIDKNPENNDPLNIMPLCPNCHLKDQHNPTANIDVGILKLFRKYKDPTILSSQFLPIYRRFKYLYELKHNEDLKILWSLTYDLINFIKSLNMGEYYGSQFEILLRSPLLKWTTELQDIGTGKYGSKESIARKHLNIINSNLDSTEVLLVELLRYQGWRKDAS